MNDMMSDGAMWGMWMGRPLVFLALILVIAALVKYLFFR